MPAEIDFTKGTRGLHHVPRDARVFLRAPRPHSKRYKANTALFRTNPTTRLIRTAYWYATPLSISVIASA